MKDCSSLERLLYSGKIEQLETCRKGKGLWTASIHDPTLGVTIDVYLRKASAKRVANELLGYHLHKISPFTTGYPITVLRPDGWLVQESFGCSLFDFAYELDKINGKLHDERWKDRHFNQSWSFISWLENPSILDQLEQVHCERCIFGAGDSRATNFGIRVKEEGSQIAVLDLGRAFEEGKKMPPPKIGYFKSYRLSETTIEKIVRFKKALLSVPTDSDNPLTRLDAARARSLFYRLDRLIENRQLPPIEYA